MHQLLFVNAWNVPPFPKLHRLMMSSFYTTWKLLSMSILLGVAFFGLTCHDVVLQ
jgi:hypothetical protein